MNRYGKIAAAFFVVFVWLLFAALPVAAEKEMQTVRVGYFLHEGYQEKSSDGVYSGYGYDYLQKIAEHADFRYEYVEGTWADCLKWLREGKIDILGFMLKTPERENLFDYPAWNCGYNTTKLLTLKSNTTLAEGDWDEFNGIRVGLSQKSAVNSQFADYAREHGFTYRPKIYATQQGVTDALKNGDVDAICVANVVVPEWTRMISRFAPQPIYYAVTKGRTQLLDKLNQAIGEIKMTEPAFEQSLRERCYDDGSSKAVVFSKKERLFISNTGPIKVAIDPDLMPIEGFDKDGEPRGFTPALLSRITQMSGLNFDYKNYDTYASAINGFDSGEYDILSTVNQGVAGVFGAEQSKVFLSASLVLVGNDSFLFAGKKDIAIALSARNMFLAQYLRGIYPECRIMRCGSFAEAAGLVKSGQADLLTQNVYSAQAQILLDYHNLQIVYNTGQFSNYRFAFCSNAPSELLSIINKCLNAIPESEVNSMLTSAMMQNMNIQNNKLKVVLFTLLSLAALALAAFFFIRLVKSKKKLFRLAYFDQLTGAGNINKFRRDAQKLLLQNPEQRYAIDVMDVKNFQFLNEFYGFGTGDRLLCLVADTLKAALDEKRETFGRIGDDVFAILAIVDDPKSFAVRSEGYFQRLSAKLRAVVKQNVIFVRGYYYLEQDLDFTSAFEKAMLAHKQAKLRGETVVVYDERMKLAALHEQQLEDRMESALADGEFKLFMQPQYRVRDESVSGAEALVRWIADDGKTLYPNDFIPIFERNGFIRSLDYYMFEQTCKKIREWIDGGLRPVPVSVNFARTHLSNKNWIPELIEIADRHRVPKKLLEIEITERTAIENEHVLKALIGQIHRAGFKVSIDDFGSGHSSLGLLQSLEADTLKLDKSFFHAQENIQRAHAVVSLVIKMAKALSMSTVAEGIERKDQVMFLKEQDCDTIQGFYYAKPMPADEMTRLL